MALILPRTPTDDLADALRQLDRLEHELPNLRAHIERAMVNGPADYPQTDRVARIVAELARSVQLYTHDAGRARRAEQAEQAERFGVFS
jgi:hypothetical protein